MSAIVCKASQGLDRDSFRSFLNRRRESGKTALIDCAERNRLQALEVLLAAGADWAIAGHGGNTALHWACSEGHADVVQAILKHVSSDASAGSLPPGFFAQENRDGETPLAMACIKNHLPIVRILVRKGAEITISRKDGITALHDASRSGSREMASYLLEVASEKLGKDQFKIFVNARNSNGRSALHEASESGQPLIAKALLEDYVADGADYCTSDRDNGTTLLSHSCSAAFPTRISLIGAL